MSARICKHYRIIAYLRVKTRYWQTDFGNYRNAPATHEPPHIRSLCLCGHRAMNPAVASRRGHGGVHAPPHSQFSPSDGGLEVGPRVADALKQLQMRLGTLLLPLGGLHYKESFCPTYAGAACLSGMARTHFAVAFTLSSWDMAARRLTSATSSLRPLATRVP